jgi:hypothetical protein
MEATFSHIRVRWLHRHADEPVLLYSELDADRYEVRKVEIFRDGSQGYADSEGEVRSGLGDRPVPSMAAIAEQPEFEPELISASSFEAVWQARRNRLATIEA